MTERCRLQRDISRKVSSLKNSVLLKLLLIVAVGFGAPLLDDCKCVNRELIMGALRPSIRSLF